MVVHVSCVLYVGEYVCFLEKVRFQAKNQKGPERAPLLRLSHRCSDELVDETPAPAQQAVWPRSGGARTCRAGRATLEVQRFLPAASLASPGGASLGEPLCRPGRVTGRDEEGGVSEQPAGNRLRGLGPRENAGVGGTAYLG